MRSARGVSGGALHQDEMGGGRGEDGATYRCRVNGVAGERREEGARKRPTRRHCAVRIPKKMLWTRKIQTVVDRDKIRKNIRFEGILRRERVCCSEHGATAWPILHTASTLRSL